MDAVAFAEWQAYESLEPFGDDTRPLALLMSAIAMQITGKWREPETWMRGCPERLKRPQSDEDIESRMELSFRMREQA